MIAMAVMITMIAMIMMLVKHNEDPLSPIVPISCYIIFVWNKLKPLKIKGKTIPFLQ